MQNNIIEENGNKKGLLFYAKEGFVRTGKKLYLDTFKKNPDGFKKTAKGLKINEEDAIREVIEFLDDPNLVDVFPKDTVLTAKTDLKKLCIDSRKQCMETLTEKFTEVVLKENLTYPKMKFDDIINVVENYFDSFYLRNSKDKDLDYFLPTNKHEINKLKIKSFKEIQGKVGVEAIEKDFSKKKKMSFAKYCVEKSRDHIIKLNNEVVAYCAVREQEVPDKITNPDLLTRANVAQVKNTVPTYLHMLNKSYQSRSTAERFFSYFPFINQAAKEERNAINKIEGLLKRGSYLKLTDEEIKSAVKKAGSDNKKNYYKEGLKNAGYKPEVAKPEVAKEGIVVEEANLESKKVDKVNKLSDEAKLRKVVEKLTNY